MSSRRAARGAPSRAERTAFGLSSSHRHTPRTVAQTPAATRGGRDRSPPSLALTQRSAYYVESSEEEEYVELDETRNGVYHTVDRHLDMDHGDRIDSSSSDDDSDEEVTEELQRLFYGPTGVVWAVMMLDGEEGINARVQALAQHGAVSRGGKTGFRVSDEQAIRADSRTLPGACKKTTLFGLLKAAEHAKYRKSAKSRDVIRREVEARLEQILGSARSLSSWLLEDDLRFVPLLGELQVSGDDVDATFMEPGPLGITFGCDAPNKAAKVCTIKHGSPAALTPGLETGMELTSVNGQIVKKWAFDDVLALIGPDRPLRLTFAYGSSHKTSRLENPENFGIEPPDQEELHTLRVRYITWRMVTVKLRASLGNLVDLLDQQWAKDVFFNTAKTGLYSDDKEYENFQEQVVAMTEQLEKMKAFSKVMATKTKLVAPLMLGRSPNHAPYSGLAKIARRSLITKLQKLPASAEGYKALVIDEHAREVLQQFVTVDELSTEAGICMVALLENERKPLEDFDVVYIVSPTNSNIAKIIDDFGGEEMNKLKYGRAHVFFTSDHLSRKMLKRFRFELGSHLVGDIQFLRMDFMASESEFTGDRKTIVPMPLSGNFFNLNMPDVKKSMQSSVDAKKSMQSSQRQADEAKTLETRHTVAERLAHVCAQLGELKPAIRWQQAAEEHIDLMTTYEKIEHSSPTARRVRSHTARTCKEIAEDLHGILKQYAENTSFCGVTTSDAQDAEERREWHSEDSKFQSRGNTCVLIVDRTVDPLAPLLHTESYEDMYEELAKLNVKKFIKDYSSVLSTQRFDQLRKLPLQHAVEVIDQKSERFAQECPRKGTLEARVQQIKRGYPFSKDSEEFSLHKKMAGLLLKRFENRKLQEAHFYEVAMANGKAGSKELDIEILAQTLYDIPWEDDKARLTLSYLITHRETALTEEDGFILQLLDAFQIKDGLRRVRALLANLSGEDKRQYGYGPHRGGGLDFGGRYTPTVCLLANDLRDHSLKENLFPYVKSSRLRGHENRRTLSTDKSKQSVTAQQHAQKARKKTQNLSSSQMHGSVRAYSRIIVFVIGGVTKAEVADVERLSKDLGSKFEVYLGSTEIINYTHMLSETRSDGLRAKTPSEGGRQETKAPSEGGRQVGGGGGREEGSRAIADADVTLGDEFRPPKSKNSSSSSSSSDDEDRHSDAFAGEEAYLNTPIDGRLILSRQEHASLDDSRDAATKHCIQLLDDFCTQTFQKSSSNMDHQLTLHDLCDAVGLWHDVEWPFPFVDSKAAMKRQEVDDSGRPLSPHYRTGEEIFAEIVPQAMGRGSPRRAKIPIRKLAQVPEIQQAVTVADAERLLKRYDRDDLGRLTFHQLEACVLRGGQLKKYMPSSKTDRSTIEPVTRQELRKLFNKLSDHRGAHPTVDIRQFAMCCRHPAHMAEPILDPLPILEPEPEPELGSPHSYPSPIAESPREVLHFSSIDNVRLSPEQTIDGIAGLSTKEEKTMEHDGDDGHGHEQARRESDHAILQRLQQNADVQRKDADAAKHQARQQARPKRANNGGIFSCCASKP